MTAAEGRFKDQATLAALTTGRLVAEWDRSGAYSVVARERVVFFLYTEGVLRTVPLRGDLATGMRFAVDRRVDVERRRRLGSAAARVTFARAELN